MSVEDIHGDKKQKKTNLIGAFLYAFLTETVLKYYVCLSMLKVAGKT